MIVGYARVSTDGQSLEAQHAALTAAGAEKVFAEKISGAVTDRRALAKAVAALAEGDVLLVTKLDRLARSTRDLLNTLAAIGDRGGGFRSLGDPWADTTTPHGKLMITVLGGLAEFERHLILARTNEGRQRAKARGVRFGRKLKLTKHQQQEAIARREAGEALTEIARTYAVSHSTISRLASGVREAVVANLQQSGQFNQPPSDWSLGISRSQIGLCRSLRGAKNGARIDGT